VQHPKEIGGQLDAIALQDLAYRERQGPARDRQRHAADGHTEGPRLFQLVTEDLILALDQLMSLERELGLLGSGGDVCVIEVSQPRRVMMTTYRRFLER
jgi:hypothetical protein